MAKRLKKLLACTLALSLIMSSVCMTALADEGEGEQPETVGNELQLPAPQNDDGGQSENYVAQVGGTRYESLKAAIEAAEDNQTVELLQAITENVTVDKALTLKGGTINGTVTVAEDTTLTIDGVTINATDGPGIAVTGKDVTLEVKGKNSVTSTAKDYAGIEVPMETSLTITGDGTLNVTGCGNAAGIGGNGGDTACDKAPNGVIVIDMAGTIYAQGGSGEKTAGGAGIGAGSLNGQYKDGSQSITINSGTIYATGGKTAAGIGSGHHVDSGAITITGGNITAIGGEGGGPGIGAGYGAKGAAAINISSGTIVAEGHWLAAGIGGSYKGGGATVTITGGDITAKGGNGNAGSTYQGAPGIGSGYQGGGGANVTISGGKINATGGCSAPGIGSGALSNSENGYTIGENKVEITGGKITAQGGCNAPGIGGGNATDNITVSITGGTIDAKGGTRAGGTEVVPGIGSATKNDAKKPGGKYEVATDATVTIGPDAMLSDGTTIGAPEGNKYYECTVEDDGTKVYKTTDHPADTVALLISGDTETAYSDLTEAVAAAQANNTVRLVTNVTLDAVLTLKTTGLILDLNGKTLTLAIKGDGLVGYSGCTIQNGNIVYTGTGNAIKAENIALIDRVDLKAENAGVGVMVYGNGCHLDKISNSTIIGAKTGISTYKVNPAGNTVSAIGEMNSVTVDAKEYGVVINLSHCGKIVDSNITGENRGISFQWHNDNAAYPPAECEITGGSVTAKNGPAIEFWDNRGVTGEGYTVATKISGTQLSGKEASTGALIYSLVKGNIEFSATVSNTNAVCSCAKFPWSNQWSESRWFDSFASAVENVNWSSRPLELLADVNETVTINKRVAVSLNGHTLNGLTLAQGGTVIADGRVSIVAPEGFVVVESVNDGTYTYTLRAVVPVSGVTLDRTTASLYTGGTVNLTATVTPDNADDKTVTWASDNEAVATVDANGVVTAVGNGTATITATVGGKSAACTVTVTSAQPPVVPEIVVTPAPVESQEPAPEESETPAPVESEQPSEPVESQPDEEIEESTPPQGEQPGEAEPSAPADPTPVEPAPVESQPDEEIEESTPPQGEQPGEAEPSVPADPAPVEPAPVESQPDEEIEESTPPQGDVPQTGDMLGLWLTAAAVSGAGLVGLTIGTRKRKED